MLAEHLRRHYRVVTTAHVGYGSVKDYSGVWAFASANHSPSGASGPRKKSESNLGYGSEVGRTQSPTLGISDILLSMSTVGGELDQPTGFVVRKCMYSFSQRAKT